MAWPVDPARAVEFLLAALLLELTPGPNMGYLAIIAAQRGVRAGLAGVAGATLGLGTYIVAAAFGLADLVVASPLAYGLLRWCGVAYLGWLAVEAWRNADRPRLARSTPAVGGEFSRSLAANLLNIKAVLLYVVVVPGFIAPDRGPVLIQALILSGLHLAISVVVHAAIVLGAARFAGRETRLAQSRRRRVTARGFAVALALTAAWLAWSSAR